MSTKSEKGQFRQSFLIPQKQILNLNIGILFWFIWLNPSLLHDYLKQRDYSGLIEMNMEKVKSKILKYKKKLHYLVSKPCGRHEKKCGHIQKAPVLN